MIVEQFYDKGLAHASYAILSEGQIALIDPARDPQSYYDFAKANNARIVAVVETHPHADFVSSHLEIARATGATLYASQLMGADYAHTSFDDGDSFKIGQAELRAINTPGHSPDSISVVLLDVKGKQHAVFTGDTLFIGDVGRPDLRESVGNMTAKREELARQMYRSTREKIMTLPAETIVYPSHGPGSLCGKSLGPELESTIGKQLQENYALQPMSEDRFVDVLLEDQPFVPKYFGFDVMLNKKGAADFEESLKAVPRIDRYSHLEKEVLIIDTRSSSQFRAGHLPGSINLMDGGKFETWLGSIVGPAEMFYLIAETAEDLEAVIRKSAKIGYEKNIKGALQPPDTLPATGQPLANAEELRANPEKFTILDIRNTGEAKTLLFNKALNIPLPELRERISEIPQDKPVVVHCAAGYRSAAGVSIIQEKLDVPVYDLSEAVAEFQNM